MNSLTIDFRDSFKQMHVFSPIACIEFQGEVSSTGESRGHYICDVKSSTGGKWIRTNDNYRPKVINESQVSNLPYVVLYRKV